MIAALAIIAAFTALFLRPGSNVSAKEATRLDQCANLDAMCDSTHADQWVNGNLNESKATYTEGESVAYRASFNDLQVGSTYAVTIEYDTTESGHHALDYLTSFDYSETMADSCAGEPCGGSTATLAIPADPNVTGAGVTPAGGSFALHGGIFVTSGSSVANTGNLCATDPCVIAANPSPYTLAGDFTGSSHTSVTVYFTADSTSAVLAWGGHIATRIDWGPTGSAVSISGSPYHMRLLDLGCSSSSNCGSGNTDRALASTAVVYAASLTVHKEATPSTGSVFSFSGSPEPLTAFTLTGIGDATSTQLFGPITDFTTYTVDETPATGWQLDGVTCTVGSPNSGSWTETATGLVLDIREGEDYDCTFSNSPIPERAITLAKKVTPTEYTAVGQTLTYTYTITNSGMATLGPTQFTISDDRVTGGTAFPCGPDDTTLAAGEYITCTATYEVTSDDIVAGTVLNTAVASGAGLTSDPAQATANYLPPITTTTSATTTSTVVQQQVTTTTTLAPPRTIGRPVETSLVFQLDIPGASTTIDPPLNILGLPTTGGSSIDHSLLALVVLLSGLGIFAARVRRRS